MSYFVDLLASKKGGVLCLGVTNDLVRRVSEHKTKAAPGFTSRYNVAFLVWMRFRVRIAEVAAAPRNDVLVSVNAQSRQTD